ncbi:MAG TPA: hypothetical protein VMF68_00250 [Spirochaetia bacterium]|nr:hypothetical protein [Spirochaetia bacterium]
MEDITAAILSDMERMDPDFVARDVGLEVLPRGLFEKRKHLRIFGVVHSDDEKRLLLRTAREYAGETYEIQDELKVH